MKPRTVLQTKHAGSTRRNGIAGKTTTMTGPSTAGVASEPQGFNSSLKPPLKWAGGKRWLLPHLASIWRSHSSRRYVEPFCGGLGAPLGLRPTRALLNDINPHLINFYTHLQCGLE